METTAEETDLANEGDPVIEKVVRDLGDKSPESLLELVLVADNGVASDAIKKRQELNNARSVVSLPGKTPKEVVRVRQDFERQLVEIGKKGAGLKAKAEEIFALILESTPSYREFPKLIERHKNVRKIVVDLYKSLPQVRAELEKKRKQMALEGKYDQKSVQKARTEYEELRLEFLANVTVLEEQQNEERRHAGQIERDIRVRLKEAFARRLKEEAVDKTAEEVLKQNGTFTCASVDVLLAELVRRCKEFQFVMSFMESHGSSYILRRVYLQHGIKIRESFGSWEHIPELDAFREFNKSLDNTKLPVLSVHGAE